MQLMAQGRYFISSEKQVSPGNLASLAHVRQIHNDLIRSGGSAAFGFQFSKSKLHFPVGVVPLLLLRSFNALLENISVVCYTG